MSSTLQITPLDPFDDDEFAAFHAAYAAGQSHGVEDLCPLWTLPELRELFRRPNRRRSQRGFLARVDGEVVGTGLIACSLLDNLDGAELGLDILPEHRRRGYGSALLAHLEEACRAAGRTRLGAEATWPTDLGASGAGWPGREFAVARGFALALGDVQRELRLPVSDELLDELAREAAPHHTGYEVRAWVGDIPDELAQSWTVLSSTLMTEAPTGEKEIEPEVPDVAALREGEATIRAQGRTRYNAVALDASGEVVAYSDVVSTVHEPGKVYQWGTLVRAADRGHRLGLAVKVANLRLLQATDPSLRRVVTWNAEVNSHMIGVNERLGFVPVARLGEFQKRLA